MALLVGGLYFLGGVSEAIRLGATSADVSTETGLEVIPHDQILLVGIADAINATVVAIVLLVVAVRPTRFFVGAVILAVIVPLLVSGWTWLAALIAVRSFLSLADASGPLTGMRLARLSIGIALAALTVTLARYTDPPARFPYAELIAANQLTRGDVQDACFGPRQAPRSKVCIFGVFLASTSDTIYLAERNKHRGTPPHILAEPRGEVRELRLFEDKTPPPKSLLVQATGLDFTLRLYG